MKNLTFRNECNWNFAAMKAVWRQPLSFCLFLPPKYIMGPGMTSSDSAHGQNYPPPPPKQFGAYRCVLSKHVWVQQLWCLNCRLQCSHRTPGTQVLSKGWGMLRVWKAPPHMEFPVGSVVEGLADWTKTHFLKWWRKGICAFDKHSRLMSHEQRNRNSLFKKIIKNWEYPTFLNSGRSLQPERTRPAQMLFALTFSYQRDAPNEGRIFCLQ